MFWASLIGFPGGVFAINVDGVFPIPKQVVHSRLMGATIQRTARALRAPYSRAIAPLPGPSRPLSCCFMVFQRSMSVRRWWRKRRVLEINKLRPIACDPSRREGDQRRVTLGVLRCNSGRDPDPSPVFICGGLLLPMPFLETISYAKPLETIEVRCEAAAEATGKHGPSS